MLSIYARSYKEAVSIISPLTIVVLVPAILALIHGTRLTAVATLIPVLNASLATRELVGHRSARARRPRIRVIARARGRQPARVQPPNTALMPQLRSGPRPVTGWGRARSSCRCCLTCQ